MDEEELTRQTELFRERYANGESLDSMLPEAFAVMREASRRVLGMRHFDVQLIGGMALHEGHIAEMKTGEGKTLVSTLAGYLNAIAGKGVHIVTVNDYLAKRDSEWMGRMYRFLGMSVGLLQNGMPLEQKRPAYDADVTYGTNSEFGFDYLRDNMVTRRPPPCSAAALRHRRRGGLHPDRRGPHPAHHLRRRHQVRGHLQGLRPRGPRPRARRGGLVYDMLFRPPEPQERRRRLRDGRGQAHHRRHRAAA